MESYHLSQMEPLPQLKGVTYGKNIGAGSFGFVKVGRIDASGKLIAIKLFNMRLCAPRNIGQREIVREALIQKRVVHPNVIRFLDYRYEPVWSWIAFEYAHGGELFDKIEPDLGVNQDVAHFYFTQLINAVDFIHGCGVAHRDIKPENLVLDYKGNLKLTDFGLATVFLKQNIRKRCTNPCGSPPYLAPEVVSGSYDPQISDIWSCGIVLFVLLTGKIAWEMPVVEDRDFAYYMNNKGDVLVNPWNKIDLGALSILRKILEIDVKNRITADKIKKHQWMTKDRGLLDENGMCKDRKKLKNKLLINLYINMSDDEFKKVTQYYTQKSNHKVKVGTQPVEHVIVDDIYASQTAKLFTRVYPASQQVYSEQTKRRKIKSTKETKHQRDLELISMDPGTLQFIGQNENLSIEQRQSLIDIAISKHSKKFRKNLELFDECFTRFFSFSSLDEIIPLLSEALVQLNIVDSDEVILEKSRDFKDKALGGSLKFLVEFKDDYNSKLNGSIEILKPADNSDVWMLKFERILGDPLEWRRMFKRVVILCRDIVYYPQ